MMIPWISHGYVRGFHNRALPKSNNPPPSSAMAGADTAVGVGRVAPRGAVAARGDTVAAGKHRKSHWKWP